MPSTTAKPRGSIRGHDAHSEPYPKFTTTSETYADTLYQNVAQNDEIDTFLQEGKHYDSVEKRWRIPEAPATREDLVHALYIILSSIVGRFVKGTGSGIEREVINTLGIPDFDVKNEKGYRMWPALVLRAAGPSFEIPQSAQAPRTSKATTTWIGFSCMATFFSVDLDSKVGGPEDQLDEIAAHVG